MFTKKHFAVLMLAAGGLASGSAFSAEVCDQAGEPPGDPPVYPVTITISLGTLAGNTCSQQDKEYSFLSLYEGFTPTTDVTIITNRFLGLGYGVHLVRFPITPIANTSNSDLTYRLTYTIKVATLPSTTNNYITQVTAGFDLPNGAVSNTKGVSYTQPDGSQFNKTLIANGELVNTFTKLMTITDTVTLAPGQTLSSLTNTYRETLNAIPEPASLALMGLGLAGLGVWRRRKV